MAPRRRPLVALLAPLLLLPLLSVPAPVPANRCLWATAIISSFWALEVLPPSKKSKSKSNRCPHCGTWAPKCKVPS